MRQARRIQATLDAVQSDQPKFVGVGRRNKTESEIMGGF